MDACVVLMAGGSGERLWPLSRPGRPKALVAWPGSPTLYAQALRRLDRVGVQRLVVTNPRDARALRRVTPRAARVRFLVEPTGRGTAACIGLAAVHALHADPNAVLVVLPVDHVITPARALGADLARAVRHARRGNGLVVFGVRPAGPATGFGYVAAGRAVGGGLYAARRFVEKPGARRARRLARSRRCFWNAGIFVGRADVFLEEIRAHLPRTGRGLARIAAAIGSRRYHAVLRSTYPTLPHVSIDTGVLEHTRRLAVCPASFQWRDVGTWDDLYACLPKDRRGNVACGRAELVDCRDSMVSGSGPGLIGAIGLDGMVVVQTDAGILVCPRTLSQQVRRVARRVRER